jgi:hypothetical protein
MICFAKYDTVKETMLSVIFVLPFVTSIVAKQIPMMAKDTSVLVNYANNNSSMIFGDKFKIQENGSGKHLWWNSGKSLFQLLPPGGVYTEFSACGYDGRKCGSISGRLVNRTVILGDSLDGTSTYVVYDNAGRCGLKAFSKVPERRKDDAILEVFNTDTNKIYSGEFVGSKIRTCADGNNYFVGRDGKDTPIMFYFTFEKTGSINGCIDRSENCTDHWKNMRELGKIDEDVVAYCSEDTSCPDNHHYISCSSKEGNRWALCGYYFRNAETDTGRCRDEGPDWVGCCAGGRVRCSAEGRGCLSSAGEKNCDN